MALLEAADGKIGTTVERVLFLCGHFDSRTGRYELAATRIVQAGGLVILSAVGGFLFVYWRREKRRKGVH
jgi:protein SCO1